MCSPVPSTIYEVEDNDSRERATQVFFNRKFQGSIATINDQDWYYVDIASEVNFYVDVSFDVSSMNSGFWAVWWYGPVENYSSELMVLSGRNLSPPSFDYFFPAFRAGRYYLRVSATVDGPAFMWNNGSYALRTSIRSLPTALSEQPQF